MTHLRLVPAIARLGPARWAVGLGAAALTGALQAHTMDVGTVTLNVVDHRVYVAATLPVRALGTGYAAEAGERITRALKVGDGRSEVILQGVLVSPEPGGHSHGGQPHALLVVGVAVFEARPDRLSLRVDRTSLLALPPLKVVASWPGPQGTKSTEVRWLAADAGEVRFQARPAEARTRSAASSPAASRTAP